MEYYQSKDKPRMPQRDRSAQILRYIVAPAVVVLTFCLIAPLLAPAVTNFKASIMPSRESSFPLFTGDAARAYSQHVCESPTCPLLSAPPVSSVLSAAAPQLQHGDVVFIKTDYLINVLGMLPQRYPNARGLVIISHNGDVSFSAAHLAALSALPPGMVAAMFAQNIDAGIRHSRLLSLPIGLENRQYKHGRFWNAYVALGGHLQWRQRMRLADTIVAAIRSIPSKKSGAMEEMDAILRQKLLLLTFSLSTNEKERADCVETLGKLPLSTNWVVTDPEVEPQEVKKVDAKGMVAKLAQWIDVKSLVERRSEDTGDVKGGKGRESGVGDVSRGEERRGEERRGEEKLDTVDAPRSEVPQHIIDGVNSYDSEVATEFQEYFDAISAHLFVASPPGNGPQAHRTWETLEAGAIPIVKTSNTAMDDLHMGLPVIQVHAWSQITQESLLGALLRMRLAWENTLKLAQQTLERRTSGSLYPVSVQRDVYVEFNPKLALISPSELTSEEAEYLSRSYFRFEKLHAGYWYTLIDNARFMFDVSL
jgi:hypothetical protein